MTSLIQVVVTLLIAGVTIIALNDLGEKFTDKLAASKLIMNYDKAQYLVFFSLLGIQAGFCWVLEQILPGRFPPIEIDLIVATFTVPWWLDMPFITTMLMVIFVIVDTMPRPHLHLEDVWIEWRTR